MQQESTLALRPDAVAGRSRVVVENVRPQIDCGRFPIKRAVGEEVRVLADVFADGHDVVLAELRYRPRGEAEFRSAPMRHLGNDEWTASFRMEEMAVYEYTVAGWIDPFTSWLADTEKKHQAGQDVAAELPAGAALVREAAARAPRTERETLLVLADGLAMARTPDESLAAAADPGLAALVARHPDRSRETVAEKVLAVLPEPPRAAMSTWYELFPRSAGPGRLHGTFRDVAARVPEIAGIATFDMMKYSTTKVMTSQTTCGG